MYFVELVHFVFVESFENCIFAEREKKMALKSVIMLMFVVFLSLSVANPSLDHDNSIRSKSNHLIENAKNGIDSNPNSKSYGKTSDEKRIQRWKRHFEFNIDADHEVELIAVENRNLYKTQLDRTARHGKALQ